MKKLILSFLIIPFQIFACDDCLKKIEDDIYLREISFIKQMRESESGLDIISMNYLSGVISGEKIARDIIQENHSLEN